MDKQQWSTRIGESEAARRAGGRRRHNAAKRRRMWERRFVILRMCSIGGDLPPGGQKQLAEHFGVHKCVISRDLAWARTLGCFGSGVMPHCSYHRGITTIAWTMPGYSHDDDQVMAYLRQTGAAELPFDGTGWDDIEDSPCRFQPEPF